MRTDELSGVRVLYLDAEGDPISTPDDAADLVGSAWSHRATLVAVPVERLDAKFFNLRSGLAGEITQKVVNYRLQLAVIGDIGTQLEKSTALRDYVRESNAGDHVWFLDDEPSLADKLARRAARATAR
ncbi:DUF4180 domain-containing protein [Agromyces bauzanensis]|uniref:DUF4180 domain-containing protein n=1 Tax=Agromyces bauzanensis TaxID=1308924 RepID=A0A917P967_9MICO|nr:DUF4180 domain-containing protein [Agromyces bauzanensis]GGJ67030.1 hypothetical protein GCM10011372_01000 [Agromyces bauzanensis]